MGSVFKTCLFLWSSSSSVSLARKTATRHRLQLIGKKKTRNAVRKKKLCNEACNSVLSTRNVMRRSTHLNQ
jgi:hypothetical protein